MILFKDKIKNNLSENNLAYIKENTKDSYRNKYILEKLQNIDFTKLNIFVSEPSYTNEYPSSLLALNMNEDTYYFVLFFIFDNKNKKWLIFDLKERGWANGKFWKEINRIKIFIPSFLSSLSTVRAMVRVYLREHHISELDEIQILSVVDELTTNAVEHAYSNDKGEIEIVLNFYKKLFS